MPGDGSGSALSSNAEMDNGKVSPIICEDELSSGGRYILDGLGSNRYFMMGSTQQTQESSSPCSLFPYTSQTGGVYAGSDGSRYARRCTTAPCFPPRASASLCARDAETSARDISSDTVLETATTRIRAPVPVSAPWLCPERDSELRCICATGRCGSNSTGTKPR